MARKPAKSKTNASSALDVLLGNAKQSPAGISSISEQFSSVMSLARADVARLMKQNPGMHITEARDIHARAQAMSAVIARRFREQRLTASVRQANRPPTGIKGLVDGPTYTDMFNPDWANHCPPDAIEATTSPVAYLADLYRYAKDLEATGDPEQVITLDARRPDLKDLVLDHTALNRVEPTLVLVNEILEKSIRAHLDGIGLEEKSVDDALLEARYPNALPFERYTSQINYVLGRKNYSLGDVIRAADPAYPYFKEPGVHSQLSDVALIQDTGFGPVQQGLLLEAPYFPEPDAEDGTLQNPSLIAGKWRIDPRTRLLTEADPAETATTFFVDNFGVGGPLELEDTQTFCLRTGLSTDELDALLSVGAYAPSRSANVTADSAQPVDGSFSGSVYINAGVSPAMAIETLPADEETGQGPSHRISHASPDRFDRMNRMIRLAKWLELPFDEVDQIVVASMRAEKGNVSYTITSDTLRALGLFQTMRRKYKVSAEDFGALIQGLGTFGRGKTASHFDRVFNSKSLFPCPLRLDGEPFTTRPQTESDRQRVDQMCAALSMPYETFCYVAKVIEQSYGGEPLVWSLDVVSSFYRMVRLPRYLSLGPVEAIALIELLDQSSSRLVLKIVGKTRVATYGAQNNADVLSVISALVDCVEWAKARGWRIVDLCTLALSAFTQPVQSETEQVLLETLHARLQSALVTESSLIEAGAPQVLNSQAEDGSTILETVDWFKELAEFVEGDAIQFRYAKGVVKFRGEHADEIFEGALLDTLTRILLRWGEDMGQVASRMTNTIMRARGAQIALVMEGLSDYLAVSPELAHTLLYWSDGNYHELLLEVSRLFSGGMLEVKIGDQILVRLAQLSKTALLTRQQGLSPLLIKACGEHPEWIVLDGKLLSLRNLHTLSQYGYNLQLSEKSEEEFLNYFKLIHTHWYGASDADKALIRDSAADKVAGLIHWNIREVLTVAFHLDSAAGVVFTLPQLDMLARLSTLARNTGLSAESIVALGHLSPGDNITDYRRAAQLALSAIERQPLSSYDQEVGQSNECVITVKPDYLVAGKSNEKALVKVSLRDYLAEPITGITVHWKTDLGQLSSSMSVTDDYGVASIELASQSIMGIANVVASYGLGEKLFAPGISIDCDEASLSFHDGSRMPAKALSNRLEAIEYRAVLKDAFGNLAVARQLQWSTTLGDIQPYVGYSDSEGQVVALLRSGPAGVARVIAEYSNGNLWDYPEVEFVSIPYFAFLRARRALVVGQQVEIECRFVELNGEPIPDQLINWRSVTGRGTLTPDSIKTDSNGTAVVMFSVPDEPLVEIEVSTTHESGDALKATGLRVYPALTLVSEHASSDQYIIDHSDPIRFEVHLAVGSEPAVGVRVNWSIDSGPSRQVSTDSRGISYLEELFPIEGRYLISASAEGIVSPAIFEVTSLQMGLLDIQFESIYPDAEMEGVVVRGGSSHDYQLVMRAVDRGGNVLARNISWSVDPYPDSRALRLSSLGDPEGGGVSRYYLQNIMGDNSTAPWGGSRLTWTSSAEACLPSQFTLWLVYRIHLHAVYVIENDSGLRFVWGRGGGWPVPVHELKTPLELRVYNTDKDFNKVLLVSTVGEEAEAYLMGALSEWGIAVGDTVTVGSALRREDSLYVPEQTLRITVGA